MADTIKVAQSEPLATTVTDVYTVPASTGFSGWAYVANRGAATTYRLSVALAGAADATSQYFAYDVALAANVTAKLPLVAPATAVVRAYVGAATVTITVMGIETT